MVILNAKFIPSDKPRKNETLSRSPRSSPYECTSAPPPPLFVSLSYFSDLSFSLSSGSASRYQCIYLIQLQISRILNIPIPYRPHDFWTACLGIREKYIYSSSPLTSCPANPTSFSLFSPSVTPVSVNSLAHTRVTRSGASRSLLAYHLNNAND